MTEIDYQTPRANGPSQRAGLIAWGVVMLVGAGCCAVMVASLCYAATLEMINTGVKKPVVAPEMLFYEAGVFGIVTVVLYLLGVGSCRARRWIRPVMIVLSVISMVNSVLILIGEMISIFRLLTVPGTGSASAAANHFLAQHLVTAAVAIVFGLGIPAGIGWFYHRVPVQATVDEMDPAIRWTDRLTLPALGWCLGLFSIALGLFQQATLGCLPAFTNAIIGDLALESGAGIAVLLVVAGILSIRQSVLGWALGVLLLLALSASYGAFEFAGSHAAFYNQMHPGSHLSASSKINLAASQVLLPAILYAGAMGYGIWVRPQLFEKRI